MSKKIVKATDQIYGTFGKARSANFTGLSASYRSKVKRLLWMSPEPNILHFEDSHTSSFTSLFMSGQRSKFKLHFVNAQRSKFIKTFFISRNGTHSTFSECLPFQKYLIFGNQISVLHFCYSLSFNFYSYFLYSIISDIFIITNFSRVVTCQGFGNKSVNKESVWNIRNWTMPTLLTLSGSVVIS